jgi:hypothetical protein
LALDEATKPQAGLPTPQSCAPNLFCGPLVYLPELRF